MTIGETRAPMPEDWGRARAVVAHPENLDYGAAAAWTRTGHHVANPLVPRGEAGIAGLAPEHAAPVRKTEQRRRLAARGVFDDSPPTP
jgi:hypothetical protein